MLVAHGVGTRADLPIPLLYAAIATAVVVVVSFVGLVALRREPRFDETGAARAGRLLPAAFQRAADSQPLRIALQAITLAVAIVIYLVGLTGTADITRNVAPWVFFVTFWVGLVPVSLLFGPVWRVINPLRLLHRVLCRLGGISRVGLRSYPARLGYRPAALSLAAFVWYELCFTGRATPYNIALFMLVYAVLHVGAALWFGEHWFERGDGFEVYSALLGTLAPIGRRDDRRLVLRSPLTGLDTVPTTTSIVAVVTVLVGSTAYDGLSRTSWYVVHIPSGMIDATAMLAASIVVVALLYLAGTYLASAMGARLAREIGPQTFANSIIPIAAAYAIAHYFSLFVFDGQNTLIIGSDPFNRGWNLFGQHGDRIDYTTVSTRVISLVQIFAIVIGHVVAVVAAHERAVRAFSFRDAIRSQIPILVSMVGLTLIAVRLVLAG